MKKLKKRSTRLNQNADRKWSLFIRLSHWFVAFAIITNLYILEQGDPPHRYLGYTVVAMIVLRLLYGLKRNVNTPTAFLVYKLMWMLVMLLGVSGFMMQTDYFFGDDWLEDIHQLFSILMQILIVSHLVGLTLDSLLFKRKTWFKMLKG